ncbi:MAG: PilW family protein [Candidatus Marithrix sp.]|nr:PilW family protein [Candidatus Marithrix sp.]
MRKSHGFSIVEIMVSLVISTILLAGVISIFNMSKRTYTLQNSLSDLQSNARFVMNELTDELRVVGYSGCKVVNTYPTPFLNDTALLGLSLSVNDDDIINTDSDAYPPSDRLVFRIDKAIQRELALTPNDEAQFDTISGIINLTASSNALIPGQKVAIRDCGGIDYYNATQVDDDITLSVLPIRFYQTPVDIFMTGGNSTATDFNLSTVMYEVRANDNGDFGLYKTINHEDNNTGALEPELFVEGVQNLQVRYGIDTDGDDIPNTYQNVAPNIGTVNAAVVSIRLTILMRTVKKRGIDCPFNKEFFLDIDLNCSGKPCADGFYKPLENNKEYEDGYCHRLFTTTVGVRNGIFPF